MNVYFHCANSTTQGGWACVILHDDGETCCMGSMHSMNSHTAELYIAAKALQFALDNNYKNINVYSSSKYVITAAVSWLQTWKANNWRTKTDGKIKNEQYWIELSDLIDQCESVNWIHDNSDSKATQLAVEYSTFCHINEINKDES